MVHDGDAIMSRFDRPQNSVTKLWLGWIQPLIFYLEVSSSLISKDAFPVFGASSSTCWHFAFGAMLSQQRNQCTDCKSAQ